MRLILPNYPRVRAQGLLSAHQGSLHSAVAVLGTQAVQDGVYLGGWSIPWWVYQGVPTGWYIPGCTMPTSLLPGVLCPPPYSRVYITHQVYTPGCTLPTRFIPQGVLCPPVYLRVYYARLCTSRGVCTTGCTSRGVCTTGCTS